MRRTMRRMRRRCRSARAREARSAAHDLLPCVLQAVRGREARAVQAQLRGAVVHQAHEVRHAPRRVLCERDGGVVARDQHQAVEQRLELDVLALREHTDRRAGRARCTPGDAHAVMCVLALHHDQRGHHLREARDRQPPLGIAPPQDPAGAHVEQHSGARLAHEAQLHGVGAREVHPEPRRRLRRGGGRRSPSVVEQPRRIRRRRGPAGRARRAEWWAPVIARVEHGEAAHASSPSNTTSDSPCGSRRRRRLPP